MLRKRLTDTGELELGKFLKAWPDPNSENQGPDLRRLTHLPSRPQLTQSLRASLGPAAPNSHVVTLTLRKTVLVNVMTPGELTCSQVKRTDDGTTTRRGHSFR